ncbi:MAG: hypothetical protein K6C10_11805 [Prevotella sp.]|nr:hypothetical protein [Prevotella sp.]
MMKRIHVLLALVAILLTTSLQLSAQKRYRHYYRYVPKTVTVAEVVSNFRQYVEDIPYFNESTIQSLNDEVTEHIDRLQNWKDRKAYIEDNNLTEFVFVQKEELTKQKEGVGMVIDQFMEQYHGRLISDSIACRDSLENIVYSKLVRLETNLNLLEREMNTKKEIQFGGLPLDTLLGIIGGIVALLLIWAIVRAARKRKHAPAPVVNPSNVSRGSTANGTGEAGIVVRRKTATILKKQSLEDVIDNPHYMKINLEDCCYESAVRRMYIKDTCLVDIFNMYLPDLEDPDNAREYGCMVLGRWVYDAENSEYYVSLEQIVLPGDDAVFDEYELNFGGKIKLKILELLRKLRRETNLQYDLTCWVHSHPGLTVFFSNADSNVQDQLKHPQHPKFLTALVIDTLTPTMETGVFTYHRDMTLNSRNDLKKLYSLVEWYEWAQRSVEQGDEVVSETPIESNSTYFNTLSESKEHTTACFGINLSPDTIVDLCMSLSNNSNGLVGFIHGRANTKDQLTEYVAERLSDKEKEDNLENVGCFVIAPHLSIPSVRKVVGEKIGQFKFVLVYTPNDGMLTSIPVMADDLCSYESYYGSQKLEDLKLWTKNNR